MYTYACRFLKYVHMCVMCCLPPFVSFRFYLSFFPPAWPFVGLFLALCVSALTLAYAPYFVHRHRHHLQDAYLYSCMCRCVFGGGRQNRMRDRVSEWLSGIGVVRDSCFCCYQRPPFALLCRGVPSAGVVCGRICESENKDRHTHAAYIQSHTHTHTHERKDTEHSHRLTKSDSTSNNNNINSNNKNSRKLWRAGLSVAVVAVG